MKLLVTGGAGFIGSAFIRLVLKERPHYQIINLDKLTYSGNLENLAEVDQDPRYRFVKGDVADASLVHQLFEQHRPDAVVHLAAESHVDRTIFSPDPAFETNLRGTFVLLEAARRHGLNRFVQVSTDEVYGSLEPPATADETWPLRPSSPYSASKAGADLLALAYHRTYGVPVIITRASNNYGPYQFPEKLIPLMILQALQDKPLPVYGDGLQVRDWIHVEDHCRALLLVLEQGRPGEIYNIAGNCSLPNLEVVRRILRATGKPESLIRFVEDRPGHDRRYAISSQKIQRELGWRPQIEFDRGLLETIRWYREHPGWVQRVLSGEYREYYRRNYERRASELAALTRTQTGS